MVASDAFDADDAGFKHCFPQSHINFFQGADIIVTKSEADSVDNKKLSELNLLYWSVLSKSVESVNCCIDFLGKRNLLQSEINKGYPNATILHLSVKEDTNDIFDLVLNYQDIEIEKRTFLEKFEYKTVFDLVIGENGSPETFLTLLSDVKWPNIFFMDYIGFERGESEERRIEKYKKWGGNILFSLIRRKNAVAVDMGVKVLKRYSYVLEYELSRKEHGNTILQHALDVRACKLTAITLIYLYISQIYLY